MDYSMSTASVGSTPRCKSILQLTLYSALTEASIKQNAQTALLRLPGEIRNRIWEFAIGSQIYFVGDYRYESGEDIRVTRHKNGLSSVALLRVCRQIYSEAALLPYQLGVFGFENIETFDWVRKLPKAGMANLTEVRINWDTWEFVTYHEYSAPELASKSLPGLRRVVVVLDSAPWDWVPVLIGIGEAKEKFEECIRAERNDVEIIFEG